MFIFYIFVTNYEEERSVSINNRINELKELIELFENKKQFIVKIIFMS